MCKITKKLLLFAFCSLLWLAAGTSSQAETMYQISASQLTKLNNTIDRAENRSNLLEAKLKILMKNSSEQEQTSIELLTELNEVKTTLKETRQNLKNANISLTTANLTLAKQEELLNQLEALVKKLEHENGVLKKQRNGWILVSAGLLYKCLE